MKKLIILLTAFALVFSLAACGKENTPKENTVSGLVTSYGILDNGTNEWCREVEVSCDDGNTYYFAVTLDTELVWKDKSAFKYWGLDPNPWDVFGEMLYVTVVCSESIADADRFYNASQITVTGVDAKYSYRFETEDKPVIYLYPEEETEVTVTLDFDGALTCTYPEYNNGWRVTASPDGTLRDESGTEYNYLYWEGVSDIDFDFSKGFCVKGEDTATFLEKALSMLGLTRREANEFIVYWLPLMENNPYNLISFQGSTYTDAAALNVTPEPDTVLRVYMAWKALDAPVEIEPQELISPERVGFTVVEWGGSEVR